MMQLLQLSKKITLKSPFRSLTSKISHKPLIYYKRIYLHTQLFKGKRIDHKASTSTIKPREGQKHPFSMADNFVSLDPILQYKKRKICDAVEMELEMDCNNKQKNVLSDAENDSDSDYGIKNLFTSDTKLTGSKRKRQRKPNKNNLKLKSDTAQVSPKVTNRPNYFLSVRINEPSIHEKIQEIHSDICKNNKIMSKTFIPIPTLHLTLFVMRLSDDVDQQIAIDAMSLSTHAISNILQTSCKEIELNFEKLNTFGGQVVFIDLVENKSLFMLRSIVDALKRSFTEMCVQYKNEEFTPHLTVMKMSRCIKVMRKSKIKRIPPEIYDKFKEVSFGIQAINEIQLCSMTDEKQEDGFYKVLATINLQQNPVSVEVSQQQEDRFDVIDLSSYEVLQIPREEDFKEDEKGISDVSKMTEREKTQDKEE